MRMTKTTYEGDRITKEEDLEDRAYNLRGQLTYYNMSITEKSDGMEIFSTMVRISLATLPRSRP